MMNRRMAATQVFGFWLMLGLFAQPGAVSAQESPDALIKRVSGDVLERVKADKEILAGDFRK